MMRGVVDLRSFGESRQMEDKEDLIYPFAYSPLSPDLIFWRIPFVVGVVKDFHHKSLDKEIEPFVLDAETGDFAICEQSVISQTFQCG